MNLLSGDAGGSNAALAVAEKAAPNKSLCPKLSLKTRLKGWFTCFCLGWIISLLSSGMLFKAANQPIKFAVLYTAGTMIALASSMFLWGPAAQCKSWFEKSRRITAIVFFSMIVLVIACVCLNNLAISNGFTKMWAVIILLVIS